MKINMIIRLLAFLALLLIIATSGAGINALFALLFFPLFFIGKPWYSNRKKN